MKSNEVIDKTFFIANRERLRKLFGGTAPIIISGNSLIQKSADSAYPFVQESNFWYLTGINEPGFTLVMEQDKEYLIAPKGDAVRETFNGSIDFAVLSDRSGIVEIADNIEGFKTLGRRLNKVKHVAMLQPSPAYIDQMTMFTNPSRSHLFGFLKEQNEMLEFIDIRSILISMRSVKSSAELNAIREATEITARLFRVLEKKRKSAVYEYELMAEISREIILLESEFYYDPIIASGINALTLHYINNSSVMDKSKFLLLDVGAKFGAYGCDVTRSVANDPTKRQKQVYDAVLAVQDFAISKLKPGVTLHDYEEAVHQYMGEKQRELGLIRTITKDSVREFYPHATSHFIGIDVHDVGDHDTPLVPGMVLTVEPGLYIPDKCIGVRIEDMVVITEDGNEMLTDQIIKNIDSLA